MPTNESHWSAWRLWPAEQHTLPESRDREISDDALSLAHAVTVAGYGHDAGTGGRARKGQPCCGATEYPIRTHLMPGGTTLAPSHRQSFVRQLTRTSTRSFAWGEGGRTKGDTKTGATLSALDVRP
jgi:hypothetical protein